MYKKYQAFWVIDASARFFSSEELTKFYDKIRKGVIEPFSAEHPAGHTILSATSEQMYNYLPLSQEGRESGMRQALTMFVVRSKLAREIVKWWVLELITYRITRSQLFHYFIWNREISTSWGSEYFSLNMGHFKKTKKCRARIKNKEVFERDRLIIMYFTLISFDENPWLVSNFLLLLIF